MKKRGESVVVIFAVLSLILSLFYTPFVLASSHSIFVDDEGRVLADAWSEDGGFESSIGQEVITYDSGAIGARNPFYSIDTLLNQFQDTDATARETIAEIKEALAAGDAAATNGDEKEAVKHFIAAGKASANLRDTFQELQGEIEQLNNIDEIIEQERKVLMHAEVIKEFKGILVQEVVAGKVNEDFLEVSSLDSAFEQVTSLQTAVLAKRREKISLLAEEMGKTELEVELDVVEPLEEQAGITTIYVGEINPGLQSSKFALTEIKAELKQVEDAGAENSNKLALHQAINEATVGVEESKTLLMNGLVTRSFEQLTNSQALALRADKFLEELQETGELSSKSKQELVQLGEDADRSNNKRIEDARYLVQEFEASKSEILAKYPEKEIQLNELEQKSRKVIELSEKLDSLSSKEYEKLVSNGVSSEDAKVILSDRASTTYKHLYGEPFIPPGLDFSQTKQSSTGFIVGFTYKEPSSGYDWKVKSNGWEYTTPEGISFEEKWPKGYTPQKPVFNAGPKTVTIKANTEEGDYIYKYSATGYEVVNPDKSSEKFVYPDGAYNVLGGGTFEIKATEVKYESSDGQKWEYDSSPGPSSTPPITGTTGTTDTTDTESGTSGGSGGSLGGGGTSEGTSSSGASETGSTSTGSTSESKEESSDVTSTSTSERAPAPSISAPSVTSAIGYAVRNSQESGEGGFFTGYSVGLYRRFRGGVSISTSLGGNIAASSDVVRAVPDLIVQKIEANYYRNEELHANLADVIVTVENIGTAAAASNEIKIDDMFGSKTFVVPALSPGEEYPLTLTYYYLKSYTHKAVVDVNNVVNEANEKNNAESQVV